MKKTIKYFIAGGVALSMLSLVTLVSCGDDPSTLPKIDGYNNSNEVAAENLKAHWTFDDTNEEDISGTNPLAGVAGTFGTVGFEDGQIGQALKLDSGALVYPPITALNTASALGNFTVSMWVYVKNNGGSDREGFTSFFGLFPETGGDFIWGNIALTAETSRWPATGPVGDTMQINAHIVTINPDLSNNRQDNINDPRADPPVGVFKPSGTWFHYVLRWNATDHQLQIFGNATSIGRFDDRGTTPALVMRVPCKAIFGSLASQDLGFAANATRSFNPMATASIDDVRVFNTALDDLEITALFNLGTAGR